MARRDKPKADFYIARCLSFVLNGRDASKTAADLQPLIKRRSLLPTAFLPASYNPEFLEWFEVSVNKRWDPSPERIQERLGIVEVTRSSQDNYFASVGAYAEMQTWHVQADDGTRPMTLAMGSAKKKPFLIAGKFVGGTAPKLFKTVPLGVASHALHYAWKPDIVDLDGDGVPEIWLRYNIAWGNGFTQVLAIYKITDEYEPVLFKEFRGANDGVARRVDDNRVEVATGFGSHVGLSPMEYDKHRLETFEFRDGQFVKTGESEVSHLLKGPDWKRYLLEN